MRNPALPSAGPVQNSRRLDLFLPVLTLARAGAVCVSAPGTGPSLGDHLTGAACGAAAASPGQVRQMAAKAVTMAGRTARNGLLALRIVSPFRHGQTSRGRPGEINLV